NTGLLAEATASCAVAVHATRSLGGTYAATVTLRNTGSSPLAAASLSWHGGSGEAVLLGLGATITQNGTRVQADLAPGILRAGQSRTFVLIGTANAARIAQPAAFT